MRQSHTAIVERNVHWSGDFSTEPYETGWAGEAIFFIRSLAGESRGDTAAVQISPDGIHWCNEGTIVHLPSRQGGMTFGRVTTFGGWLRLLGRCQKELTVLVTLALKE